jgi:DNA end-binding protein Ku
MAQIIWRGAISFGLVHIPVRLYPAISHQRVGFDLLDKRSMDPIGYRKVNKRTGKEVDKGNIVRGFEYEKDQYVVLSDEEIKAANPESTQTIDIVTFVDAPEISFLYLDTPYFLAPDRGGDKVYALLRDALKKSGRIGIANVVLHSKQHLASLIPVGSGLALNTLRWADEVRDIEPLKLPSQSAGKNGISERELKMATQLIDDMTEPWDPERYHDTFHDEILKLVQRKIKLGKTGTLRPLEEESGEPKKSADILDLTEMLKRSLSGKSKAAKAEPAEAADSVDAPARAGAAKAKPAAKGIQGRRKVGTSGGTSRSTKGSMSGAAKPGTRAPAKKRVAHAGS